MKSSVVAAKVSFKEHMFKAREDAIVHSANRLLSEKGFDAMTVDEVAASVGIAKASLYKHFPSKEHLAAAAMVRMMQRALQYLGTIDPAGSPLAKLQAVTRWTMALQLAGEMPSLPSQNSSLRASLMADKTYLDALVRLSDGLGEWIEAAQKAGEINPSLPPIAVLYTLYARACDPVLGFLKSGGRHSDEDIVELVAGICFEGLKGR